MPAVCNEMIAQEQQVYTVKEGANFFTISSKKAQTKSPGQDVTIILNNIHESKKFEVTVVQLYKI
jgi:hypothetical protein